MYAGVCAIYMDRTERKWLAGNKPMSAAAYIYYILAGLESCPASSLQHLVRLCSTLDTGAIQKVGHWRSSGQQILISIFEVQSIGLGNSGHD